ncbi:MAG: bifunctional [glutamine synthetase] adenylyltransferase/[glutamine synthetase]-adenylyl-L-tyrosine phosphorylase [Alphaproteobacteria bacterium]
MHFLDKYTGSAPKSPIADPARITVGRERWVEVLQRNDGLADRYDRLEYKEAADALLDILFAFSPYLTGLLTREPAFAIDCFETGLESCWATVLETTRQADHGETDIRIVEKSLRQMKRQAALLIAMADIADAWALPAITQALSDFAAASLNAATGFALADLVRQGVLTPPAGTGEEYAPHPGYVFLGMGKLGSGELNYSSDIDLIALYDPQKIGATDPDRLRKEMIRATQTIVGLMDKRTADGYVFRTDLRLRPDPGMTPIALTVNAAISYYESVGQNWERAAMIKARPVAGDLDLGEEFLTDIRPFVWRKHLDFAAIQDIHSIKRQINAHRGGAKIAIEGHNIKTGRGGIREIEFFAQTQQLIWGGRDPSLRDRNTLSALRALAGRAHTTEDAVAELSRSYDFLRTLEHRLQMINDTQTQTLPTEADAIDALGGFMGYDDPAVFRGDLKSHLETVERHYAGLFEESPELGGGGALVFTGEDDDPDTIETLKGMGFETPSHVAERVRTWHRGRYRATRSERSRQILTELMPLLLGALSKTPNPDQAFSRFDGFLEGLPAGVQLFALFHSNPALLDLVAEIMGAAPGLADRLMRRPLLLDSLLETAGVTTIDADERHASLDSALSQARDYEDILDICRSWVADRFFQVGVGIMQGKYFVNDHSVILTDCAETALKALIPEVVETFREQHGDLPGGGYAVVAMGKFGGGELAPKSDLDLVFIYDAPPDVEASDGPKPLGPSSYYLRLCQRAITAITAQTAEGPLFEVDTRLRPGSNSGPVATMLERFTGYYRGEAWTWEHMALTRARFICGSDGMRGKIETAIADNLCQRRDNTKLIEDIRSMRVRIANEYPGDNPWDMKYRPGGLIDVEFIAQFLQLQNACDHPACLHPNTASAILACRDTGLLDTETADALVDALTMWRNIQSVIRVLTRDAFDEATAPEGQFRAILKAAGNGVRTFETLQELRAEMDDRAQAVCRIYDRLLSS